jgi:hypothetical protein
VYDYKLCSRGQHSNGCLKVSGSLHLTPVSSLLTVDKCGVIFFISQRSVDTSCPTAHTGGLAAGSDKRWLSNKIRRVYYCYWFSDIFRCTRSKKMERCNHTALRMPVVATALLPEDVKKMAAEARKFLWLCS